MPGAWGLCRSVFCLVGEQNWVHLSIGKSAQFIYLWFYKTGFVGYSTNPALFTH